VGCGLLNTDKKIFMGRAGAGVVGRGIDGKQAIELYEVYLKEIKHE